MIIKLKYFDNFLSSFESIKRKGCVDAIEVLLFTPYKRILNNNIAKITIIKEKLIRFIAVSMATNWLSVSYLKMSLSSNIKQWFIRCLQIMIYKKIVFISKLLHNPSLRFVYGTKNLLNWFHYFKVEIKHTISDEDSPYI